ncbi:MAG: GDSL-type esterase/lipase family protein [Actinomycetota bacterium]
MSPARLAFGGGVAAIATAVALIARDLRPEADGQTGAASPLLVVGLVLGFGGLAVVKITAVPAWEHLRRSPGRLRSAQTAGTKPTDDGAAGTKPTDDGAAGTGPTDDGVAAPDEEPITTLAPVIAAGTVAAIVVAVVVQLALGFGSRLEPYTIVAGGAIVITALSVWGVDLYHRAQQGAPGLERVRDWWWAGVWLVVLGMIVIATAVQDPLVALLLAAVAAGFGVFFVWPGEGGFLAVLVGLVLVWVAADAESGPDPSIDAEQAIADDQSLQGTWYVAIGDSYISGEGADTFYTGTNAPGDNSCHRAPTAWPERVAQRQGVQVKSFACSGATIDDVRSDGQYPDADPTQPGSQPQLAAFEAWLAANPGVDVPRIFLSVGGNDAGFSSLIAACLMPSTDCGEIGPTFVARTETLEARLASLYLDIVERFSDARPISPLPTLVVTPYPDLIGEPRPGICSAGPIDLNLLAEAEAEEVNRYRAALNGQIDAAAAAANASLVITDLAVTDVDGGESAGEADPLIVVNDTAEVGGDLCGSNPAVHWVRLQPPDGDPIRAMLPTNWIQGSLHPNERGHRLLADATLAHDPIWVETGARVLVEPPDRSAIEAGDRRPAEAPTPWRCGGETDAGPCTDRWLGERGREAVAHVTTGLGLAMAGGLIALSRITPGWILDRFLPGSFPGPRHSRAETGAALNRAMAEARRARHRAMTGNRRP